MLVNRISAYVQENKLASKSGIPLVSDYRIISTNLSSIAQHNIRSGL